MSELKVVKPAFLRDQAPDEEKCLVFGDLLTGSARNWYRHLSRTTRGIWKELLINFLLQYCGRGLPVTRQYYPVRKGLDKSAYLYRLNIAGLSACLQIKDDPSEVRHFIETLDRRDLADHLALLRIPDPGTLEEALRYRQRATHDKAVYGSIKPRQKNHIATAPSASTRAVRAVKAIPDSSESEAGSSGSESEAGLRRVHLAVAGDDEGQQDQGQVNRDRNRTEFGNSHAQQDRQGSMNTGSQPKRCSHCGSRKHSNLGCWGRLMCEKCGRKDIRRSWSIHAGKMRNGGILRLDPTVATVNQLIDQIDNTCDLMEKSTATI
ncbi:LOW QUALITY PROTEIN: Hypothetical protein PHPALM_5909 [Phytophthora palmivora]|uniref:Retrotransposon gag domain-containing protein n=1 Tax=Phytophthora palmivora TaxID=4796 RepID=A0A2P4YG93_9STRA|nr:LOW QUALITY PROTEIN: Hypothetical protein PHPALM_5909 [Phytophthora palmivora]